MLNKSKTETIINELVKSIDNIDTDLISDGYHTFKELYDFRFYYNVLLFNTWSELNLYNIHKSWRHSDGELCFGGGWFIVVAELPTGQISNHYEGYLWKYFRVPEREIPNEYDGHTSLDVQNRLLNFLDQNY
jgi:hypothetical protein